MAKADAGRTKSVRDEPVEDEPAEDLVMTSLRITKTQARQLEIVSDLTGRTKAAIHRDALDALFKQMISPEAVETLANAHRERLERQQEELRKMVITK